MKILIADDQSTIRTLLREILEKLGFDSIVEADDGDVALEKLREDTFGLIISDIHMDKMSGLELLSSVKDDAILKDIPFLLVSSENTKQVVLKAIKAGIDDYILKPFSLEVVKEKLTNIKIDIPNPDAEA